MGARTRIRASVLALTFALAWSGTGGTTVAKAAPDPAEELALLRGSGGDWDTVLCMGCGAMLVAWAGSPLGLMMLGPGGARFGAACALQCLTALE